MPAGTAATHPPGALVQGPYTNEAKQRRELVSSSQGMPVTECYRAGISSLFSENDRWMWETFLGTIFTGPGMLLNYDSADFVFLNKKTLFLEKSVLTVPAVY